MDKHLSSQFDAELNELCAKVMEMGGLVEQQLTNAIFALAHNDLRVADDVIERENRVNSYEVEIDHECGTVIAKRQPTARDLRLLMAVTKSTTNLERAGDEAVRIARLTKTLMDQGMPRGMTFSDLRLESDLAGELLRKSLDAFARLDTDAAAEILRDDALVDKEFEGYIRKLITYVMEDPRTIGAALDLLFVAKAIERIGDHAKNIAEMVIYIVKGTDVRHAPPAAPQ
ncbi:MAG: phosphate signaling complex protein PhoU [Betaproteobacteria bacterium]|nr:phosphate signaling complex protein PhoU [Betaproteobacteria bacterium]MDE2047051.1 phosphate signaling complex protein PhoU [Betaproteobacteria bacterium]